MAEEWLTMTVYIGSLILQINIFVQARAIINICILKFKLYLIHTLSFQQLLTLIELYSVVLEHRFRLVAINLKFADLLSMKINEEILHLSQSECDFDVASEVWFVLWH